MRKSKKLSLSIVFFGGGILFFLVMPLARAEELSIAIIDSGATAYVDGGISFTSYKANEDPLHHGTIIAGLIRKNNPTAKIFMLQVCEKVNGKLVPSQEAIKKAIQWAVENKMKLVNMSFVTHYDSEMEKMITKASRNNGIVFVAAAGNRTLASHFAVGNDGLVRFAAKDPRPAFPASSPDVISVGAVDSHGHLQSYSANACDIYTSGDVLGEKGTSFAAARITARVAKILSKHPYAQKAFILSQLKR